MRRLIALLCLLLGLLSLTAAAHTSRPAHVKLKEWDAEQRQGRLEITFDAIPFILGHAPGDCVDEESYRWLDAGSQLWQKDWNAAAARCQSQILLQDQDGGAIQIVDFSFPTMEQLERLVELDPRAMPYMMTASISFRLEDCVSSLQVLLPELIGTWMISFQERGEWITLPVAAGTASSSIEFGTAPKKNEASFTPAQPDPVPEAVPESSQPATGWRTITSFLHEGLLHIWAWDWRESWLPPGLDHIAFVLGLCLLAPKVGQVFWNVSSFTLAHTCSFALCLYGLVRLPGKTVECLVSATLIIIALEIFRHRQPRGSDTPAVGEALAQRRRLLIAFGFGLIHGLAFAGDLLESDPPRETFPLILLGFNIGVECAHILLALPLVILLPRLQQRSWYRPCVTLPLAGLILALGLWTFTQRAFA